MGIVWHGISIGVSASISVGISIGSLGALLLLLRNPSACPRRQGESWVQLRIDIASYLLRPDR